MDSPPMSLAVVLGIIAAVSGVVTISGAIFGIVFRMGQHSQRLKVAESNIAELQAGESRAEAHRTEMAVLRTLIAGMQGEFKALGDVVNRRIDQMDHDLRNLITGKFRPATRGRDE